MSLEMVRERKKPVTPGLVVGKTIQYGLLFFFLSLIHI